MIGLSGFIVPVMHAWDTAREIFPPAEYKCASNQGATRSNDFIQIFYSDCGHQNGNGMLLTSSVWYTVLTGGLSPVDLHPSYPGNMTKQWDPGCAAGGVTITTGSYGEGATELIDIFNHGTAVNEIRKGWDIVVLQGWLHAESANVGDREKLIEAVVKFNEVITSTGAQTVLYQTFPGQNQGSFYSTMAMILAVPQVSGTVSK